MKKIFTSLIVLYIAFFFMQFCFNYFKRNHEVEYNINNFTILEDYRGNTKNEVDNYYLQIKTNNNTFHIQTFENFNREKKIVKDIKHFEVNGYECILPIFQNQKVITDFICMKDNIQNYYQNLNVKEMEEYVSKVKEYNANNYVSEKSRLITKGTTTYYIDNNANNHYLALTYYKGLKIMDKTSIIEVELFSKDKYSQKLNGFINNKYFVIDYENNFDSQEFITLNIRSKDKQIIGSDNVINFDSYIQGIVGSSAYIFDKDTKIQYELDLETKSILRTGNQSSGIKYYDGTWSTSSAYDAAQKEVIFKKYDQNNEYIKIDKVNGNEYGITYYVKQNGKNYDVYESPRNSNQKIYLFTTTDYKTLKYIDNYIYFEDANEIKYYSNTIGIRTIAKDNEILNNDTIKFNVIGGIWRH